MRTQDEKIARGKLFRDLKEHKGWQELEKILKGVVDSAQEHWLENEETDPKVKLYARANKRILTLVDAYIVIGEKAEKKQEQRFPIHKRRPRIV